MLAYYSSASTVRGDMAVGEEKPGDQVTFEDPFDDPAQAFLESPGHQHQPRAAGTRDLYRGLCAGRIRELLPEQRAAYRRRKLDAAGRRDESSGRSDRGRPGRLLRLLWQRRRHRRRRGRPGRAGRLWREDSQPAAGGDTGCTDCRAHGHARRRRYRQRERICCGATLAWPRPSAA